MPVLYFAFGALAGLIISRLSHHRRKEVRIVMSLELQATQKVSVTVTALDGNGNPVVLPDGTTYAFELVPINTPVPAEFTQDPTNPADGELVAEVAGVGVLKVTVTLPDGTVLYGQSDQFDVAAAPVTEPASIQVEFGTPE